MLKPFFVAAMLAPGRHLTFRRTVGFHVAILTALAWAAARAESPDTLTAVGHLVIILGIVEGGALVGWRLTQMPKSQALEFLLVSPVQPHGLFLAESLVGVARFALVCLAGLPVLLGLLLSGTIEPPDLWVLAAMPFVWGVVAGLALTAWAYESVAVRRVGELVGLLGVLVYLVVGILAGEHLRLWLQELPPEWAGHLYAAVMVLHHGNPFGVVRNWFDPGRTPSAVWQQFEELHLLAVGLLGLLGVRAAFRLRGHFHDRHYGGGIQKGKGKRQNGRPHFTFSLFPFTFHDSPLSWWAVRRVMDYSGRSNLYLAGGFSLLYAAYIVAGDQWPAWMGRLVFQIFEAWGGAAVVAAAMCVMAAVPAAFQFGLWDPTVGDRCKRLELLLLTDLDGGDYWRASLAAAWRRGRGYLAVAAILWLALAVAGRAAWYDVVAAALGGAGLWLFSFAVGFRTFSTGHQSSGIASLLTLGLPMLLFALLRAGFDALAALVPTAACYLPLRGGLTGGWVAGFGLMLATALYLSRRGLARCEPELRAWYDANQGRKGDAA